MSKNIKSTWLLLRYFMASMAFENVATTSNSLTLPHSFLRISKAMTSSSIRMLFIG